jgi:hypothetical protein
VELIADGDETAGEREAGLGDVDVGPLEAEDLVAAHAGHGGEPQHREQPVTRRGPQERLQLRGGPRLGLGLLDGPEHGRPGDEGDVAGQQAASHRFVEGASDDEVHLVHGLWRQRRALDVGVRRRS